ncbi:ANTAR domain-containing protein [Jatrophihabitans sp. DSM 45814]
MTSDQGAEYVVGPAASVPIEAELEAREADLRAGLENLASMVAGAATLEQLLDQVAISAVHVIPGADGVGISLLRLDRGDNRVQALATSHSFVAQVDAIQYELVDEGPCITAAAEGTPIRTGNVTADPRWPRFGPRVGRLGVHSVLSLPMLMPDGTVVGAVNSYSRSRDTFDDHSITVGRLFAAPAALAVHNAQVLAQAQGRAVQLQAALGSRAIIDQAIGILRSRSGATADEAFTRLRDISQTENVKLTVVAERIVDESVRRARARHTHS